MLSWFTTKTSVVEESLTVSDVLTEEYNYLHQTDTTQRKIRFTIVNPQGLIDKLASERQQMLAVDANKDKPVDETPSAVPPSTAPPTNYPKTPFTHLAEWLDKQIITKDIIQQKLQEKAQDKDLLTKETWLIDAATRSYTSGLVEEFRQQQAEMPPQRFSRINRLNQLLLEDAFSEYIRPEETVESSDIFSKLIRENQCALCLSGGGIRSATFALGIVQGLAQQKVLSRFTYLSTVSGGGYLGSWLSAWSHHEGFDTVIDALNKQVDTPLAPEAAPVRHLRQYSNYLSPQLGFFSADSWTLIATYIRNLLLVWLVILPFLAALTAVPWVATTLAAFDIGKMGSYTGWVLSCLLILGCLLAIYAIHFIHAFIPELDVLASDPPTLTEQPLQSTRNQAAFIKHCLLPLVGAILVLMLVWMWSTHSTTAAPWSSWLLNSFENNRATGREIWSYGGIVIMVGTTLIHVVSWLLARPSPKNPWLQVGMFLTVAVTGWLAGFLILLVTKLLHVGVVDDPSNAFYTQTTLLTVLGLPCFLLAILLAGYVFEGVTSRFNNDARREWTARYSAWVLIVGVCWLIVTCLVLFGPKLLDQLEVQIATVGVSSSLLTGLLGWSSRTAGGGQGAGSRQGKGNSPTLIGTLSQFILPIVAVLTLVILLIMLSRLDLVLFRFINAYVYHEPIYRFRTFSIADYETIPFYIPLLLCLVLLAAGYGLGSFIDTNRFSLHAMYRARLIRAYLGASRPESERQPDPFTGFDERDNLFMGQLDLLDEQRPADSTAKPYKRGPFHIINIALNLTSGKNLAWQERKAESFTVSPLHAGATTLGYRRTRPKDASGRPITQIADWPTDGQGCYGGGRNSSISLGTAMTISGAAASPNMGYHSSPLIAFLMTLLNVRLGWWLGNPGPAGNKTFFQKSPKVAITPILDELFGHTDNINKYVYLSDGGHFENLGLYEMVLRRNRFIIVSDASCDEQCTFEDLGNAIRKIRIDLGIPIEFTPDFHIRARSAKTSSNKSGAYWAFARIRYSAVCEPGASQNTSADEVDGLMLYIKPAFYGQDEPRDVVNYALSQVAFPHESTGDQFFTESQFESYRALGKYVIDTMQAIYHEGTAFTLADLFNEDGPQKYWSSITTAQAAN